MGFFSNIASNVQRAATPQTGFWSSIAQIGTAAAGGVLQYNLAKMQQPAGRPGTPPYFPPLFPPPSTQSNIPEVATRPQTRAKNGANGMVILLVAGAGLLLFLRR